MTCRLRRLADMVRMVVAFLGVVLLAAGCSDDGGETTETACDPKPVVTPVPEGYGGLLFDTHVHLDDAALVEPLDCSMRRTEVEAAVVHTFMDPNDPLSSQGDYLTATGDHDSRLVPAFHVAPATPEDLAADRVRAVLNEAGLLFVGVGEVDFHDRPWADESLAAEPWPGLFELADERDLFVVVDLRGDQADELDQMLDRFPDTKVLVVGGALRTALPDLLRDHENLFVALTAPALLPIDAHDPRRFVERFDGRWERLLSTAAGDWLPVVQAAPRRVMWGSDATEAWHGEAEVYGRVTAFTRAFLDRLPRPMQGSVALTNARRLFGVPTPPQPDA